MVNVGGISEKYRRLLDNLNRSISGPFSANDASKILDLPLESTRRLLGYWAKKGWLSRIRRGFYVTVPLGTLIPQEFKEDPWVVALRILPECYIGGWSAAEYWNFTDQIFKDIVIFTSHKFREKKMQIQGTIFILNLINKKMMFGLKRVWRKNFKVSISDPARTIVDILNIPSIGGGIRHVSEITKNYFDSEHKNEDLLIDYAEKLDNKTIYKRLGYIIEILKIDAPLAHKTCRENISKGYSILDPDVNVKGKILRKWNLRINVNLR